MQSISISKNICPNCTISCFLKHFFRKSCVWNSRTMVKIRFEYNNIFLTITAGNGEPNRTTNKNAWIFPNNKYLRWDVNVTDIEQYVKTDVNSTYYPLSIVEHLFSTLSIFCFCSCGKAIMRSLSIPEHWMILSNHEKSLYSRTLNDNQQSWGASLFQNTEWYSAIMKSLSIPEHWMIISNHEESLYSRTQNDTSQLQH